MAGSIELLTDVISSTEYTVWEGEFLFQTVLCAGPTIPGDRDRYKLDYCLHSPPGIHSKNDRCGHNFLAHDHIAHQTRAYEGLYLTLLNSGML